MICPKCGAEYRAGFTICHDCDEPLVESTELIRAKATGDRSQAEAPTPVGDPDRDPFCSFWKGTDPRVCTELCTVLDEAGIPHKTIRRQDHLFNVANQVPFELGVPASLYEKAELAIKEAFGTDETTGEDVTPLLNSGERNSGDFEKVLLDEIADANEWLGPRYPEDATVEAWAGDEQATADMIEMSLRENDVMVRKERQAGQTKLLVLPEDETRAKEIVREIVEGVPPE